MKREEVLVNITRIMSELLEINEEEINEETSLSASLDFESLDIADLLSAIEEEYDMTIPDKDIKKLQTVKDIVDYVMENA